MAKKQRLDKILANLGYGSRKDIRKLCKDGIITVDGEIIKDSSSHVDPENSKIIVGAEDVNYREYVYIMLNKPPRVISATYDPNHRTVVDLLDKRYQAFELFPVGRLDKDTEGLLLITNDGNLSHTLLSPKKHIPKTYFAKIQGIVTDEDIQEFEKGIILEDGYKTLPAQLKIIESNKVSEIEVTIYEGKYHQVKRMFEAVGKSVIYLKRLSMGNLALDPNLALGEYRELLGDELKILL